jgi:hypothetical protein
MVGRDPFLGDSMDSSTSSDCCGFVSTLLRTSSLFVAIGGALCQPPRETILLTPKLRLPCLRCDVLLHLAPGLHRGDHQICAREVPTHGDRVFGGSLRQLFLEA